MSDERKALLEEWDEVRKGLEEAIVLLETSPDDDNMALCADFEAQLEGCVQRLNNSERQLGLMVTPNTRFIRHADGTTTCLFTEAAPYQVHYDGKKWYSCVIVSVVEPAEKLDRVQYKAWILGYNQEETVTAEELRRWQLDLPEPVLSGQRCSAIYPSTGKFMTAVIDKITPKNTVVVKFQLPTEAAPQALDSSAAPSASPPVPAEPLPPVFEEKEVPITHILNGRVYPELRKVEKLTAAQKKEKAVEKKAMKRQREVVQKVKAAEQAYADMLSNNDLMDCF